jgi:hypothetical protein
MSIFLLLVFVAAIAPVSAQHAEIGGFNVYYGSLHNHCDISDGEGSAAYAYKKAKATSNYDFFGLSDHAEMMTSSEWNSLKENADINNEDGFFVTFWGFEWSSLRHGHVTVVGSNNFSSSISLFTNNFSKLVNWVSSRKCVAFFNHPGDYDSPGPEFNHFDIAPSYNFVGMELWNDYSEFDRYFVNDGYHDNDNGLSYYDEALQREWRIGACGNEDNHNGSWGVSESKMAVLASDLTRNSVYDALKSRRFYSTLDRNMEVSFKIQGQEMGSILHAGSYKGEIRLHDADNELFTTVELFRNGMIQHTFYVNQTYPQLSFSIDASHGDYYYIRVSQQDGDQAISSPVFFDDQIPVNYLPEVTMVSPLNGSSLSAGVINFEANATDFEGTIVKVAFYLNDVFIGIDSTLPYSIDYNISSNGINSVTALAFDDRNAVVWAEPSSFMVSGSTGLPESLAGLAGAIKVRHGNARNYISVTGICRPEKIMIADFTGRIVYNSQINPSELLVISRDDLPDGIYLVFMADHPEVRAQKLIIE